MRKVTLVILSGLASSLIFSVALCVAALAGEPPCLDSVRAQPSGSTILVYHDQAEWNCCATIEFSMVPAHDTLNVIETETFAVGPCHCNCCFDLSTSIVDLSPGTYLVRVLSSMGEVFGEVSVTVEVGQFTDPVLGESSQSPCGGWAIGKVNETWGYIKVLYR